MASLKLLEFKFGPIFGLGDDRCCSESERCE